MNKPKSILDRFIDCIGVFTLLTIIISISIQIIYRYVFNHALSWPEELCRYAFGWCSMAAVTICMRNKAHLKMDLIQLIFSAKIVFIFEKIAGVFNILFLMIFAYLSYESTENIYEMGFCGAAVPFPQWIIWSSMPVMSIFIIIYAIINLFSSESKEQ